MTVSDSAFKAVYCLKSLLVLISASSLFCSNSFLLFAQSFAADSQFDKIIPLHIARPKLTGYLKECKCFHPANSLKCIESEFRLGLWSTGHLHPSLHYVFQKTLLITSNQDHLYRECQYLFQRALHLLKASQFLENHYRWLFNPFKFYYNRLWTNFLINRSLGCSSFRF